MHQEQLSKVEQFDPSNVEISNYQFDYNSNNLFNKGYSSSRKTEYD